MTNFLQILAGNSNLTTLLAALLGALVGGLCPIFVNFIDRAFDKCRLKKSTKYQIASEIKAILKIIEKRRFINKLRNIEKKLINGRRAFYHIQITLDVTPIYKSNLVNLGLLDVQTQADTVQFYRYLDSMIEDVKQGGSFSKGFGLQECRDFLNLADETIELGNKIVKKLI